MAETKCGCVVAVAAPPSVLVQDQSRSPWQSTAESPVVQAWRNSAQVLETDRHKAFASVR